MAIFGVSLLSLLAGLAPVDLMAHGIVSTGLGILSLYLYQDAVASKAKLQFRQGAEYVAIYFFLGLVLLLASNCLCEIGEMKVAMVAALMPVIGLLMIVRMVCKKGDALETETLT